MDLQLSGKNVFVTGSGQGLGRAIGLAYAEEGANVAFHYNSSSAGAEEAVKLASDLGVKSIAVRADLHSASSVATAVDEVVAGLGSIDILVNNAAVTARGPFLETVPADWESVVDVTVTGTLRVTHAVAAHMVANGGGSIVNLMGDSGRVGESGLLLTATTRSTTIGLTKSLALELARHKIRANAVAIALVQTDNFGAHVGDADEARMKKILSKYPLRRLGRADDVTPTVLLLSSPRSGWTTGQILSVNGGYSMP